MSTTEFNSLFDKVTTKEEGWREALVDAWPCLSEDQKLLLEVVA